MAPKGSAVAGAVEGSRAGAGADAQSNDGAAPPHSPSRATRLTLLLMDPTQSLQDQYAPQNRCFGCGPANDRGLRIKSYVRGDEVVATWTPEPHHQAFEGMLNGGIAGALLDCHSNWTAAWTLMKQSGAATPPCAVTAEFHVKLRAPTPLRGPLELAAHPSAVEGNKVVVEASIKSGEQVTATCRGVFVAVKEGHPAYGRW